MSLYLCGNCQYPVYFENPRCLRCEATLGFDPQRLTLLSFDATQMPWRAIGRGSTDTTPLAPCGNRDTAANCNWMRVPRADEPEDAGDDKATLCAACALTSVLPDQSIERNRQAWRDAEQAKRRWLVTILGLGLTVPPRNASYPDGMQVRILQSVFGQEPAITGHANGVITIDAAECDPVARVVQRSALDEPYRTVLGHFRHESGHYFWQTLVARDAGRLADFRRLFGDESRDYGEALRHHYDAGPPAQWHEHYVSAYAASHPWEDFAETWAHYLHLVDLVNSADAWGLTLANYPSTEANDYARAAPVDDPRFAAMLARWLPVALFANTMNRSLGHEDAYPFAPSANALLKMGWIHDLVTQVSARQAGEPPGAGIRN